MNVKCEWASYRPLLSIEFFVTTLQLMLIENRVYEQTGVLDVRSSLHYGRRFEYPWVLQQEGWPNLGYDAERDVFSMQQVMRGGRVLDAGGGLSTFPLLLTKYYSEVFNVDVYPGGSLETLQLVQEKMGYSSLHLVRRELSHLPFDDGFFDVSFCISVLEHRGNKPGDIIDELLRVTKKKLLVTVDVTGSSHPDALSEPEVFNLMEKYRFTLPMVDNRLTLRTRDGSMDFNILCLCFEKE